MTDSRAPKFKAAQSPAPVTPEQKRLVRESFALVEPIADQAAALFYGRLFEIDPALKPLFKGDIKEQGRKLMATIKIAVGSLDRLDTLVPTLKLLGAKHRGSGVEDGQYDTVASALLWTLGQGLKDKFTAEVRDAWVAVYGQLAAVMKSG